MGNKKSDTQLEKDKQSAFAILNNTFLAIFCDIIYNLFETECSKSLVVIIFALLTIINVLVLKQKLDKIK